MKRFFGLKLKRKNLIKNFFVFFLVILITIAPALASWLGFKETPFVQKALAQQVQTFTTADNGTWTAPLGVTEVIVECWGAGGGGGTPGNNQASGGGGGGAYSSSTLTVTPEANYSYTVGAGSGGGTGGDTFWVNTSTVLAKGGAAGAANGGTAAGGAAASGVGTVRYSGGTGDSGGGGGAGSGGNGLPASGTVGGGATADYGGSGGTGINSGSGTGLPGNVYGGGGGGSRRQGAPQGPTTGADGFIRITYTVVINVTVGTTGTQRTSVEANTSDFHIGGAFTLVRDSGSTNVTSIKISNTGTISNTNLSGLILYYKQEATCSTTIPVDATQFNSTAGSFTSGSSTVTGTMSVGTSQICLYVEVDIGAASNGDTVLIQITNPSTDVVVAANTVQPNTAVAINGTTTVAVNQAPSFTVFSDDGPKDPGTNITFSATASDPDGDNVILVVCKTAGVTGTECDGGAGDTWCTSTLVASNPSCAYSIPTPTPDTSYNVYPYVFDEKNKPSGSTLQGALDTYTVNNVAPTVSGVTINGGAAIDLTAGTTKAVTITGTVTDNNSCEDVSSVLGYAYRSGVTYTGCDTLGEANNNYCYPEITCTVDTGTCTGSTDASATYTCTGNLQYYADPTDANTQYPTETWLSTIKATDNNAATGNTEVTQGVEVNSLMGFNITAEINYGSLGVGESNDPLDRITTITPTGNIGLDHEVYGPANMCTDFPTCTGGTIAIAYQKYALSAATSYSLATALTTLVEPVYTNVPKPTSATPTTKNIWWGMLVPDNTSAGSYDGSITIIGYKSDVLNW